MQRITITVLEQDLPEKRNKIEVDSSTLRHQASLENTQVTEEVSAFAKIKESGDQSSKSDKEADEKDIAAPSQVIVKDKE